MLAPLRAEWRLCFELLAPPTPGCVSRRRPLATDVHLMDDGVGDADFLDTGRHITPLPTHVKGERRWNRWCRMEGGRRWIR